MSLDSKIREMATERLDSMINKADAALRPVCKEFGVSVADAARILSRHKTKSLDAKVIKQFSDEIGTAMLQSVDQRAAQKEPS